MFFGFGYIYLVTTNQLVNLINIYKINAAKYKIKNKNFKLIKSNVKCRKMEAQTKLQLPPTCCTLRGVKQGKIGVISLHVESSLPTHFCILVTAINRDRILCTDRYSSGCNTPPPPPRFPTLQPTCLFLDGHC